MARCFLEKQIMLCTFTKKRKGLYIFVWKRSSRTEPLRSLERLWHVFGPSGSPRLGTDDCFSMCTRWRREDAWDPFSCIVRKYSTWICVCEKSARFLTSWMFVSGRSLPSVCFKEGYLDYLIGFFTTAYFVFAQLKNRADL